MEERVNKSNKVKYTLKEIEYFILKRHMDYYNHILTKFLNNIIIDPLNEDLKDYIKNCILGSICKSIWLKIIS